MHKNATKCNETLSKWCKNKHGASKIMDTFETYQERCMSWEFRDSSHGMAYRRGLTVVTMGPARDCANGDTSVYPGSGPSPMEVKPLLPACFVLSRQWLLQCSLSCSARGGRSRLDLPSLRVQTPLYRRGSGYRLGGGSSGYRLLRGCVFGVIPWPRSDDHAL
jgi:hypothetical protein